MSGAITTIDDDSIVLCLPDYTRTNHNKGTTGTILKNTEDHIQVRSREEFENLIHKLKYPEIKARMPHLGSPVPSGITIVFKVQTYNNHV